MGDVVSFRRPNRAGDAYVAEVRELCWLARIPDAAERYIRRRTPIPDVLSDCIVAVFGKRLPRDAARYMANLTGRAGNARHALPLHPGPYGIRRRPD